jgi:hypothetical protein
MDETHDGPRPADEPGSGADPGKGQGESSSGAACSTPAFPALPDDREAGWALWRQDDNGHRFLVCVLPTREQAEAARKDFEARGHKQVYFVEPFHR